MSGEYTCSVLVLVEFQRLDVSKRLLVSADHVQRVDELKLLLLFLLLENGDCLAQLVALEKSNCLDIECKLLSLVDFEN